MDFFKYLLFGVAGLSIIFWVCVIALWHTYMFPRLFKEDYQTDSYSSLSQENYSQTDNSSLIKVGNYSNKSFVIANFNPIETSYSTNRLYTTILISLGFMSFILITFGLQSGFKIYGLA